MNANSGGILNFSNISDFLAMWLNKDLLSGEEKKVFDRYYISYKKRFGEYIKHHYNQQTMELMELIDMFERPLCLEVGCGCGTESLWMAYKGNAIVKGIDLKKDRLNVARKRKEILEDIINKPIACSFEERSLFDLDDKFKYDIIWMEQTLHHLEPRGMAFDKISELVRKGGYIVISETNAWNPLIQMRLLLYRGFSTIEEFSDELCQKHLYGNEHILTPRIVRKELEKRNIFLKEVRYFRLFPNKSWSLRYEKIEKEMPQWFRPAFTHYNLVGERVKEDE
jgi:2-polyprenyl-3-methyl-5-hydroxy-6-metoxy-1,4-benzoquinol methylase